MRNRYLKSLSLLFAGLSLGATLQAQECGTLSYQEEIQLDETLSPEQKEALIAKHNEAEAKKFAQWDASARAGEKADVYVIPLVFHIFHKYGDENISKSQINNQIKILNDDFNGENSSLGQLVEEFKSIAGNTEIEFRLASIDPDGNCTSGINRVYNPSTYYDGRGPIQQLKRDYGWPSNKYMNIYVVGSIEKSSNGGTILGYAQFPGGNPATDGFVVRHDNVGSIGTSNAGRATTSTHEIGHLLGLYHTWGNGTAAGASGGCNWDDGVSDTPNTIGHPSTCNLGAENCGSLDNVQNFMDYATCAVNFTAGQSTRMRGVLENDNSRANLHTTANLQATGSDYAVGAPPTTLCEAVLDFNDKENYCPGEEIVFTDRSFHSVTSRTWTFEDATPASSGDATPSVSFDSPGMKTITLTVTNGVDTKTTSSQVYISSPSELGSFPYSDDVENVDLSNRDQYEIIDFGGNIKWGLSSSISNGGGSKSFYLPNVSAHSDEGTDEIVSNTMDLSGAAGIGAKLGFDVAFARRTLTNSDQLRIAFSNDCGVTWLTPVSYTRNSLVTAPNHTSAFFPSGPEEWATKTVDIPEEFYTENFQFKFTWISSGGNNAFIDNINVSQTGTGIDETIFSKVGVNLFPNPASNQVELSLDLGSALDANIAIVDLLGKNAITVYTGTLSQGNHNISINTTKLKAGVYFLKISSGNESKTEKLIISK